jgi:PKD repeat protein
LRNTWAIFLFILIISIGLISGCVRKERDNKIPIASFNISPIENIYINDLVKFTDTSNDIDGKIEKWNWDFGDNTTSKDKNPIHTYSKIGTYIVTLQVIDDYESKSNKTHINITVTYAPPHASFTTDPEYLNDIKRNTEITFTDTSIPGDGNITEYFWNLGDGNTSNLTSFTHIYKDAGIYIVILTVKDENGITDRTEKITIEVE